MNFYSKSDQDSKNNGMTGLKVVKTAYLSTNEYFFKLVSDITFVLILFVCVLVALWLWPLKMFGPEHLITKMFSVYVYLSLCVVILFYDWLFIFLTELILLSAL